MESEIMRKKMESMNLEQRTQYLGELVEARRNVRPFLSVIAERSSAHMSYAV